MAEKAAKKQHSGAFKPGQSGNPMGKPKGCLNRATRAALALLDGEAEAITRKAVEMALGGDSVALRLCLERIAPAPKDRPLDPGAVKLPRITAGSLARASASVVAAVAEGRITPSEGVALAGLLENHRKAVEIEDIERRLARLESAQAKKE